MADIIENNGVELDLESDIAKGTYINVVTITHSPDEFVFDMASMLPGFRTTTVQSRLIMTPKHAKQFLLALEDNIMKYENKFGRINTDRNSTGLSLNLADSLKGGNS